LFVEALLDSGRVEMTKFGDFIESWVGM
jgi:hypothetical protein